MKIIDNVELYILNSLVNIIYRDIDCLIGNDRILVEKTFRYFMAKKYKYNLDNSRKKNIDEIFMNYHEFVLNDLKAILNIIIEKNIFLNIYLKDCFISQNYKSTFFEKVSYLFK